MAKKCAQPKQQRYKNIFSWQTFTYNLVVGCPHLKFSRRFSIPHAPCQTCSPLSLSLCSIVYLLSNLHFNPLPLFIQQFLKLLLVVVVVVVDVVVVGWHPRSRCSWPRFLHRNGHFEKWLHFNFENKNRGWTPHLTATVSSPYLSSFTLSLSLSF